MQMNTQWTWRKYQGKSKFKAYTGFCFWTPVLHNLNLHNVMKFHDQMSFLKINNITMLRHYPRRAL